MKNTIIFMLFFCQTAGAFSFKDRLGHAFKKAYQSKVFLYSLAGAAALHVTKQDQKIANYAFTEQPLFKGNGIDHSDFLWDTMRVVTLLTALPHEDASYRFGMTASSMFLSTNIVVTMKANFFRPIPNNTDEDQDNPSLHASDSFNAARLITYNIQDLYHDVDHTHNYLPWIGASLAGWARIEDGAHYPGDILISAAVGDFAGIFMYELFYPTHDSERRQTFFQLSPNYLGLSYHY